MHRENVVTQDAPTFGGCMIESRLDEILERRGKSLYWLQKETGFAYTTLWKLRTGKADSIRFEILDKICTLLDCSPGDLLVQVQGVKKKPKK